MRRKKNVGKSGLFVLLFAVIVAGVSFGYAQLRETLTINGTAKINSVQWNVNMRNLELSDTSVIDSDNTLKIHSGATDKEVLTYTTEAGVTTASVVGTEGGVDLTFNVTLKEPGQVFEFGFNIANDGTLDALLNSFEEDGATVDAITTSFEKAKQGRTNPFFRYTITGIPAKGSTLAKEATVPVTVRLEYLDLDDAADLPDGDFTFTKTIHLNYVQK